MADEKPGWDRRLLARVGRAACFALIYSLLCFWFGFATLFLSKAFEQPHPQYCGPHTWFSLAVQGCLFHGSFCGLVMGFAVFGTALCFSSDLPDDCLYRPYRGGIARCLRRRRSQWVLILAAIFLGFYWYVTSEHYAILELRMHGLIWPPHRITLTVNVAYGALWLADVISRPSKKALAPCVAFLLFLLLVVLPFIGTGLVVE